MPTDDELDRLRAAIDVCNRRLVAVLHERAQLVRRIGACKAARRLPPVDPAREAAMLAAACAQVPADGYPTAALRTILAAVFAASRPLAADPRA
jgi:chorismate mutase